jgi:hypothetical protein
MTRYLALAFATLSAACTSVSATAPSDAPTIAVLRSAPEQTADLSDEAGTKSTVPMITDAQKDGPLEAVARALHVYWFFGSR